MFAAIRRASSRGAPPGLIFKVDVRQRGPIAVADYIGDHVFEMCKAARTPDPTGPTSQPGRGGCGGCRGGSDLPACFGGRVIRKPRPVS